MKRRVTRRILAGVAVASAACASSPPPPAFINPAGCAEMVARYRSDPDLQPDAPPGLITAWIVPENRDRARPEDLHVDVVVTESGQVADGSVVVTGSDWPPNVRAVTKAAYLWRFQPAKAGSCWVPSRYTYRVTM